MTTKTGGVDRAVGELSKYNLTIWQGILSETESIIINYTT